MTWNPRTLARAAWPWFLSVTIAAIICGPALTPGHLLIRDMVFVPNLTFTPNTWGTGTALPRAVPSDGYIAIADNLIPGHYLGGGILLATLTSLGVGIYRLAQRYKNTLFTATTATILALWNPYIASRLAIGHWALLVGIAALPWLINAKTTPGRIIAATFTAFTPTSGLLAATWLVATSSRTTITGRVALAAATNAPWIFAGLAHAHHATTTTGSARLFTPSGSTPLPDGPLDAAISTLIGAGIWNTATSPPDTNTWPATILALAILALGIMGLGIMGLGSTGLGSLGWHSTKFSPDTPNKTHPAKKPTPNDTSHPDYPDHTTATICWALTWTTFTLLTSIPAIHPLLDHLTATIPGTGILRDSQKYTAPLILCTATAAPLALTHITHKLPNHAQKTTLLALASLPIITNPHTAIGLNHQLTPTHYPHHWHHIAQHLHNHPTPTTTAILPQNIYLNTTWTGPNPHLDPLPRLLPGHTIATDTLTIDGHPASSEDQAAQHLTHTLTTGGNLATLGITHIAHHGPAHTHNHSALGDAKVVVSGDDLTLYEVVNPNPTVAKPLQPLSGWRVWLVYTGWGLHLLVLGVGLAGAARQLRKT